MHDLIPVGGVIRKLWIGEAGHYRDHLLRLDAESRHNRFAGAVSDDFIRSYVDGSFGAGSVVHGFFVDGVLRGAAELRCAAPTRADAQAEVAFSVEPAWQSHGIGSALLERTLLTARNRGVKSLRMTCLSENRRMQKLARKFAAEISFDFGGVVGDVKTPHPTPLSLAREIMADGHGLAATMLDAQSRLLRPH